MTVQSWGFIDYEQALVRQREILLKVQNQTLSDHLIFCSHPSVVTLGRGTQQGDITTWSGSTYEIERGGRATYHGPGQLIVYPILNLNLNRKGCPARDIGCYLKCFTQTIADTFNEFGLVDAKALVGAQKKEEPSLTGVWVKDKKVAAVGIAIKRWVSFHGAALFLKRDSQAFSGIRPCGFQPNEMAYVEDLLDQALDQNEIQTVLSQKLEFVFSVI
jgi:lipoyl(octanoyl) transferase